MLTSGALIGAAFLFGTLVGPHLDAPARAQEPQEEEPPTVEELLGALIKETRGLRGDVSGAASGGDGGLSSDVRAIRQALEKRQAVRIVELPHDADGSLASAESQERALSGQLGEGYRLIAVSEGFAYLGKR